MVSERLRTRISRDFSGQAADAVVQRLNALDLPLVENESRERIQAAIVLLADGNPTAFEYNAGLAEKDWRDVLVFSSLGNEDWPVRLDAELGRTEIADPS